MTTVETTVEQSPTPENPAIRRLSHAAEDAIAGYSSVHTDLNEPQVGVIEVVSAYDRASLRRTVSADGIPTYTFDEKMDVVDHDDTFRSVWASDAAGVTKSIYYPEHPDQRNDVYALRTDSKSIDDLQSKLEEYFPAKVAPQRPGRLRSLGKGILRTAKK